MNIKSIGLIAGHDDESLLKKSMGAFYDAESLARNTIWKCISVAKNVISYNTKMEVTGVIKSTPETKMKTVSNSLTTVLNLLISMNKYNPVRIMAQSDNSYVRKPTRFMQQQLNDAILRILTKPKECVKLLEALGAPLSTGAYTGIALEMAADEWSSITDESAYEYMHPGQFISESPDFTKVSLLLEILGTADGICDKYVSSLIKETMAVIMAETYVKAKKCAISLWTKQKSNLPKAGNDVDKASTKSVKRPTKRFFMKPAKKSTKKAVKKYVINSIQSPNLLKTY
ncbi:MAG: hypothetical protein QS748_12355 [Candidatus Endonucleobacter bathymodioli]|uniref:Uncharacterized protein n=1 Tax=Candidatus Endonucleibacter bathymodioli TaxID=539814 RepID=A0AA90SND0_9GAMM|nr:hypothetical protein [Candidatus Endonucleobacter bathymodioli]